MSDKIHFGGMKRQGCGILVCFTATSGMLIRCTRQPAMLAWRVRAEDVKGGYTLESFD